MIDYIKEAKANESLLLKLRKHLHENPELSGEEIQTIQYIHNNLTEIGIPHVIVEDGGIIGFIRLETKEKKNQTKRSILLRADCDALPIHEDTDTFGIKKPYISKKAGVMHACGHDFHTASLLVSAKILKEHQTELDGDVILLFERSEEQGKSYLTNLLNYIDENHIKVDTAFGIHVGTQKAGVCEFAAGPANAGIFVFEYTIKGLGGHGSRPYKAVNPIACFQAIAAGIDQLRMTKIDPYEPATLTICSVNAGAAANVIPDTLTFSGNGRYFDKDLVGTPLKENLKQIVHGCVQTYGCEIIKENLEPLGEPNYTATECADLAKKVFETEFTSKDYRIPENYQPSMGSESFARIAARYPSILIHFGVTNESKGITAGIHHPKFDIDLSEAYRAPAVTVAYVMQYFSS